MLRGLRDTIKSGMTMLRSDAKSETLEEVQKDCLEWTDVENLMKDRSKKHVGHYKFNIKVKKLWRIKQNKVMKESQERSSKLGKPTRLFHGTPAAESIIENGFQLPNHPGMFGKGIYFAGCPLKSVQYVRKGLNSLLEFAIGERLSGAVIGSKQMLLCDVYLGKTYTRRSAWNKIDPSKDLQCGSISKFFGGQDYNSVTACSGLFGAVHVPEYIVYEAHQAIPRYLVEFESA